MNTKIILSILATIIGVISFFPYLRDVFKLKTKPHLYTWLIWSITQGTAVLGILYGGGGWGVLSLLAGTLLVILVLILSLKYGSKDITLSDKIILMVAIASIIIWWKFNQPVFSIIMVSLIDFIGYIPSFRKTYKDPWSETSITWLFFSLSNILAILSIEKHSILTTCYLMVITIANLILFFISYTRRIKIKQSRVL
ncbi:MAG: hypothetical protein EOM85_00475 [Candidatus Moranbacteria bacterium]|nr:hypothetical protein [Candidatus Moranbacteria bacterium]